MKGQIKRKLRKKWQYNESIPEKLADLQWPSGRMHRSVFWWDFSDIERLNSDRNSKSLSLHSQSILFVRKTAAEQAVLSHPPTNIKHTFVYKQKIGKMTRLPQKNP